MTPEPDEISICDNCGREFPFPTGVAVDDDKNNLLFLCPECYHRDKLIIELIKEWRAESEKNWVPLTTPDTANYIYAKCADQLEKLIGEVSEKSSDRDYHCHVCGVKEGEFHKFFCSVGNSIYRR